MVGNNLSSHTDNLKNVFFLILGEGDTFGIYGSFGVPEKKVNINTKFYLNLHYNADNSYLFVNEKEIYKFKFSKKIITFQHSFV